MAVNYSVVLTSLTNSFNIMYIILRICSSTKDRFNTKLTKHNRNKQYRNKSENTVHKHIRHNANIFQMFQCFALSAVSGHLQLREYIMWHCKENGADEDICVAAAGFMFLASQIPKQKNKIFWGVRQALGKRKTATYKPLPHSRLKM
jgi:hypothetical protein